MTGLSSDTKPTSNLITGSMFQETNTDDLYLWDGDSWNVVAGASAQVSFLDEDNFSSDSATAVASQQSIKAYVASQVPGSQNVFSTLAVSGQDNVVADAATDTLTLVAGSNMTITTTAGSDTITFAASGGTQNLFQTIAVSGQSDVVADSSTDTLTLAGGSNITLTTNASTDTVTIAASSSSATVTVTDNEATNENNLITFVADAATSTGAHGLEMDGDLHYNPSTGTVTSTVFAGALTGNATTATTLATARTIGGTSFDGSAAIVPATITVADTTDTTAFVALFNSATGDLAPKTDAGITYNAGTGTLTATAFVGPITGDVTGNASGTAATVTGAAQTAITSVGTLTGLDLTSGDKTIFATVGNNTLTVGASNTTVNIAGDLTVGGDATTFNTATVSVEDPLMILASNNNAADAVDIGFYGLYDTSGSLDLYSGLFRDANDSGKWKLFKDLQAAPTTTVNTSGTGYAVGTLVANIEGNVTGSAGTATGLAGSATVLATARTISASGDITWTSASFNGSANVTSVAAITADVIINADVKSDAAIAYSKLAALTDGNILVGNGSNVPTSVNPSGDIDITNAGVFSIASGVIVDADVNASAAIAYSKLAALADGNILVGNVSNVATSVNPSGDIDVTNAGVFSIASDVVVNADIKSDAAIVDTKLATISTADKVAGGAIQIDSGTDGTGITIAATDKFLIDDGGTTKYVNASQVLTYTSGSGASESFAIAMAVAL